MAQGHDVRTGDKRAASRLSKSAASPATKKLKTTSTSTPTRTNDSSTDPPLSASGSPAPIVEKRVARLPSKVTESRPLPCLVEPQPFGLSSGEYQDIATSGVVVSALERSRARWTNHGVLSRYWVKPETGKSAKPPPPGNPETKWMKSKGECRIRLEPHVFTADVYIEEKSKKPAKQQQQLPQHPQQFRPPPPPLPHHPNPNGHLQPGSHTSTPQPVPHQQPPPSRLAASSAGLQQSQNKKASADPVISLLAERASSNPELKRLMKEVATGNANAEQLRVFQEHIDELTEIIKKQREDGTEQIANGSGNGDAKPPVPASVPAPPQPVQQQAAPPIRMQNAPPQPYLPPYQPQQAAWVPPAIIRPPVILAFKDPGATEDRFFFPQMSILEPLSPQHELVSFIAIKSGDEAIDPSGLDPEQKYWQPITMMVEVAYGREEIINCIRRWVKPPDEVRKYMEDVMKDYQRAPSTFLALRLPYKGAAQTESEGPSKEGTPTVDERTKSKSTIKQIKKPVKSGSSTPNSTTVKKTGTAATIMENTPAPKAPDTPAEAPPAAASAPTEANSTAVPENKTDDAAAAPAPGAESNNGETRPRRNLRKSVRIEG